METLALLLLYCGAVFILLAAVGIVRMPDLYTRMQSTTKATTLGTGCIMLGVAFGLGEWGAWARAAATVVFLYMTAPVAAHLIARAGYFVGTARWRGTVADALEGRYDEASHELQSTPAPEENET